MAIRRAPLPVTDDATVEVAEPSARLFTVDEYYRMAEVGILHPDERVELIEGVIVQMPPIGPRHAFNVTRLTELLMRRLAGRAMIRSQSPIRLDTGAEPEPDVAAVRFDPANPKEYEARHPSPRDALLVIEVADTTLAFDLGEKALVYSRHDIADLWVIDLIGDVVVVHRQPTADGYASVTTVTRGMTVSPLAFPDVEFTADEILR
jgi:Uma2 family endonuclease